MFAFELAADSPLNVTSNPPGIEHRWIATGTDDHDTIQQAALLYTPPAVATVQGTLYRQDVRLAKQGHGVFYVHVPYGPRDRAKWTWRFSAAGGTHNIKASLEHIASYVAENEDETDHHGAINRQIDGTVQGADVVIPQMTFTLSATFPAGIVTPAYARQMFDLVGKVNSTPFMTFQPGEVLCIGGDASDGTECEASVSMTFLLEPNRFNFSVGGIAVERKDGHDYAWIQFKQVNGGVHSASKPVQVDVCRVYPRANITAALGLGG